MRETIEKLLDYINENCVEGRDDLEIGIIYYTIGALYGALDAIKSVEIKSEDY